jgi:hypothetical protein
MSSSRPMRSPAAASSVGRVTTDLFLATIEQGAPMSGALLAIAGGGWLLYRLSSRRRPDRRREE